MLIKKIATGIAAVSLISSIAMPAAFAQTVEISGNGSNSDNTVTLGTVSETMVQQGNDTTAVTTVNSTANSGGNNANGNTGGGVLIDTGNAVNETTVTVTGGDNTAMIAPDCGCEPAPVVAPLVTLGDVVISGNGNHSTNTVTDTTATATLVGQGTTTTAVTTVTTKAKSGKNKANNNTGPGTVSILTGNSRNTTSVTTTGGSNTLLMGLFALLGL